MKRNLILTVLALTIVSLAWGQNAAKKPNFSGTWKLNPEKSDLGGAPVVAMVQKIKHQEDGLELETSVGGKVTSPATTVQIGGKERTIDTTCCGTATLKFWWEGQTLHSEFKWESGIQTDARTLSEDGKTMIDLRTLSQNGNEQKLKFVLEKQ